MEVETQIQVAENLGNLNQESKLKLLDMSAELGRIVNGLLSSVSRQAGT